MTDFVVEAELREETGRSAARRMRRAGKLPGIIYGGDKPDLPITMDYNTVSKLLNQEAFHTSMLEVKVKGSRGKNTVLLKDSQYDPLKDTATHLDFMRVSAADSITMEVPVIAINFETCPGVAQGGMVALIRHALEVTCRADSIPESIEIDCTGLEMGATVHIEDVTLPEGAEVHHDVNFTILNIAPPKAAEAEETEESAEAVVETETENGSAE
ncbi:50S ribosomal protein L25/general stress protein Ctc [Mariprofundus sp. NF]|jgi:large subunit ribosomal protein L25|uniref:50S ribosomal protein L25/general stress protein Ctc n=1 Tax=Mariprofundus sp. NF TaxID=2608716 RepID=UPI0015A41BAC|nr:50S ribosomal protein L25/general stress protein Ctc [Mariprofundus sp. NF]NWF37875.1 50S ribosomal protein L25/general stress protein Ctc [Mariprofundus sp. NF]